MKKITIKEITLIGIMAAAVYVASAVLQIPIPTAIGNTRLHMGNVMCLLSGMLLGAVPGGLAAGIGSMFFDLTNPAYITSAPFTFAFKFIMAWVCGKIVFGHNIKHKARFIGGAAAGAFIYVFLYITKNFIEHYYFFELPIEAVIITVTQKGIVSVINAIVSVIAAVPLGIAICPAIKKFYTEKN